jgi:hypothetical protein
LANTGAFASRIYLQGAQWLSDPDTPDPADLVSGIAGGPSLLVFHDSRPTETGTEAHIFVSTLPSESTIPVSSANLHQARKRNISIAVRLEQTVDSLVDINGPLGQRTTHKSRFELDETAVALTDLPC